MGPNPFKPRAGRTPPVLAGRDVELNALIRAGRALAQGVDGDERILVAPRGYGKTALLTAFEDTLIEAAPEQDGFPVRVVSITAADMETVEDLGFALARIGTGKGIPLVGALGAQPIVLIVDEGAAMQPTPTRALLNAVQHVNRRSARVLLVIGGTPDIEHTLNQAHATFWDKARKTRLDLLEPDASRGAIETPLADAGIDMDPGALGLVANESHGYPYFLQAWGNALYEHAERTGTAHLTPDDVDTARSEFETVRNELYAQRVGEMDRQLSAAAVGVAKAFHDSADKALSKHAIWEAIDGALQDTPERRPSTDSAYRALKHLGFFWRSDARAGAGYRRGIPSLMDYAVRELAPPSKSRGVGR